MIVLLVFLLFPEFAGITTHLFQRQSVGHYRLVIPLTWIIARSNGTYQWVIAGRGIGLVGLVPYWRREEHISEMVFYGDTSHDKWNDEKPPAHAKVLSEQKLTFGQELLTCWDIVPYAKTRPDPVDPAFAEIICNSSKNDFYAHFSGWRIDSSAFYKLLLETTERE